MGFSYDYKIAKNVLCDADWNRLACALLSSADSIQIDWDRASTAYGSASTNSYRTMYYNALKKIADAGGKIDKATNIRQPASSSASNHNSSPKGKERSTKIIADGSTNATSSMKVGPSHTVKTERTSDEVVNGAGRSEKKGSSSVSPQKRKTVAFAVSDTDGLSDTKEHGSNGNCVESEDREGKKKKKKATRTTLAAADAGAGASTAATPPSSSTERSPSTPCKTDPVVSFMDEAVKAAREYGQDLRKSGSKKERTEVKQKHEKNKLSGSSPENGRNGRHGEGVTIKKESGTVHSPVLEVVDVEMLE